MSLFGDFYPATGNLPPDSAGHKVFNGYADSLVPYDFTKFSEVYISPAMGIHGPLAQAEFNLAAWEERKSRGDRPAITYKCPWDRIQILYTEEVLQEDFGNVRERIRSRLGFLGDDFGNLVQETDRTGGKKETVDAFPSSKGFAMRMGRQQPNSTVMKSILDQPIRNYGFGILNTKNEDGTPLQVPVIFPSSLAQTTDIGCANISIWSGDKRPYYFVESTTFENGKKGKNGKSGQKIMGLDDLPDGLVGKYGLDEYGEYYRVWYPSLLPFDDMPLITRSCPPDSLSRCFGVMLSEVGKVHHRNYFDNNAEHISLLDLGARYDDSCLGASRSSNYVYISGFRGPVEMRHDLYGRRLDGRGAYVITKLYISMRDGSITAYPAYGHSQDIGVNDTVFDQTMMLQTFYEEIGVFWGYEQKRRELEKK